VEGELFHHLVQQYWLGLPVDKLTRSAETSGLKDWWDNFLNYDFKLAECKIHPELVLAMQIGKNRLIAKYDLVAVGQSKITIFDWKTNQKRPSEEAMAVHYQTRVYRNLMVNAGGTLMISSQVIKPEQVEMVYWFVNFPNQPIHLPYTTAQSERDGQHLNQLISHIEVKESFPLTPDEKKCKFCLYRSYCDRGISAAELDDENLIEVDMPTLDLDQVSEIEY
jgi:hypothetical protein